MRISIITFLAILFLVACSGKKEEAAKDTGSYYTCSMHPQVMEKQPGKCPICQMDLIEVRKSSSVEKGDIVLTEQQIQLANIQVNTIRSGTIGDEMILPATLAIDQNRTSAISARIRGRVERLYFNAVGDYVPRGAKLYDLYSEELNNAKQEYVTALERRQQLGDNFLIDFDRVIEAARNKLLLWGLKESQIRALPKSPRNSRLTSFYSDEGGYITGTDVTEGGYVDEGGVIVRLADLSSLWAEAQLYSSQLSYLDPKAVATVRFPSLEGKTVTGKISFQNPELNPGSRINLVRIVIPNKDNQLKPGMVAFVSLKGQPSKSLTLPGDAVLRDSKGATVWIKTGKNTFRNKMVTIGTETDDRIEIQSGLQEGDQVVTFGAYLINSEYIFKQGSDPMAGMGM
ncbi:MAG TPA: efflux RND transporter periplasmic adaptor subunit [Sphingobacteriaceae bacterium]|nr:efflux RND transporter periplasmic adaptor subunit [Sphingobacteriaceae bacterium]